MTTLELSNAESSANIARRNKNHPNRPVMYASVRGSVGVVKRCGVGLNSMSWPVSRKAV